MSAILCQDFLSGICNKLCALLLSADVCSGCSGSKWRCC